MIGGDVTRKWISFGPRLLHKLDELPGCRPPNDRIIDDHYHLVFEDPLYRVELGLHLVLADSWLGWMNVRPM